MPNLRDLLNHIKWTQDLSKVQIWILHRGAPKDRLVIQGSEIVSIERSFLQTSTASIPFHRIVKILYEDTVVFQR